MQLDFSVFFPRSKDDGTKDKALDSSGHKARSTTNE